METFINATVLLDGLDKDNEDVETGERLNGIAREKIRGARGWFAILCGVGEDGDWPQASVRHFIRQELSGIEDQIETMADSPASHFIRWKDLT